MALCCTSLVYFLSTCGFDTGPMLGAKRFWNWYYEIHIYKSKFESDCRTKIDFTKFYFCLFITLKKHFKVWFFFNQSITFFCSALLSSPFSAFKKFVCQKSATTANGTSSQRTFVCQCRGANTNCTARQHIFKSLHPKL